MQAATKTALQTAANNLETALVSEQSALTAYLAALETANAEATANERAVMGAQYGLPALLMAIQQSMGAKPRLIEILKGRPEQVALVGVRLGGDVGAIIASRLPPAV